MLEKLKEELVQVTLNYRSTIWWCGRVGMSTRDPGTGLVVIKASGIRYEEMRPQHMVVVDMDGKLVEGDYKPSSDVQPFVHLQAPSRCGRRGTHALGLCDGVCGREQTDPGGVDSHCR